MFVTPIGNTAHHDCFETFVTTPPLKGMGADLPLLRRMVAIDPVTLDLLGRALQNPHGGDLSNVDNIHDGTVRPSGTSADCALRRLRRQRPELHARAGRRDDPARSDGGGGLPPPHLYRARG